MKTVLHVIPQLRLGAGRYVVDTAIEQARLGVEVWVALGQDAEGPWRSDPGLVEELREAAVRVVVAGDLFHRNTRTLCEASRSLADQLPGAVLEGVAHAHTAMAAAAARWAGVSTVVVTCHGWNTERDEAYNLQDALALRLVDALTSPSEYWARLLKGELGIADVSVIPVGLDLRRFPPLGRSENNSRRPTIVTVAELTARKGIADLLDAMPAVWREMPGVELHLMGDGDARGALQAKAAAIDATRRRVIFHGFVSEPYSRLPHFDLFCLPSRSDNFPVALMEALLAGLPVVATDVGGIPELVAGSGGGTLVASRAPGDLAAAILNVLRLDPVQRRQLGRLGERFVRERCAIQVTVRQLHAVYETARTRRVPAQPCT